MIIDAVLVVERAFPFEVVIQMHLESEVLFLVVA